MDREEAGPREGRCGFRRTGLGEGCVQGRVCPGKGRVQGRVCPGQGRVQGEGRVQERGVSTESREASLREEVAGWDSLKVA